MTEELRGTARKMVERGKGLLAADESTGSAGKRLAAVGVASTLETRRQYRDLFLSARGVDAYLSGVILFDETMRQRADDGTPFPERLARQGILPGIKVDQGRVPLPDHPGETATQGLGGLEQRLAEYRALGARFCKWRAAFPIAEHLPSPEAIFANTEALAQYAQICHAQGLVPIVEPEVLMDGDHDLATAERVTGLVLRALFDALDGYGVDLSAVILKTSMAVSGSLDARPAGPEEVGEATARLLRDHVPPDTAGVVFLSGGEPPVRETEFLNAVARRGPFPWPVTFSFARALQGPTLEIWRGRAENVEAARAVFLRRLELDALASLGLYEGE